MKNGKEGERKINLKIRIKKKRRVNISKGRVRRRNN